jgi:mannonate dehydratase
VNPIKMTALVEVKFDGIVILDHTPEVVGGHYRDQAYGFAYMKAFKNRAIAERKA